MASSGTKATGRWLFSNIGLNCSIIVKGNVSTIEQFVVIGCQHMYLREVKQVDMTKISKGKRRSNYNLGMRVGKRKKGKDLSIFGLYIESYIPYRS